MVWKKIMIDKYYSDFKETLSVWAKPTHYMHRQELNVSLIKVLTV